MNQLILLAGRKSTGKDTAAAYLVKKHGYTRLAFADAVKEACFAIDPIVGWDHNGSTRLSDLVVIGAYPNTIAWWDGIKNHPEVRRTMQRVATEAGRHVIDADVWVDMVDRQTRDIDGPVVVTDLRFLNEAHWGEGHSGTIIRVRRPEVEDGTDTHISETELDQITAHYELWNTSSYQDLYRKVEDILEDMKA